MSDLASTSEKDGGLDPAGVEAVRAWYLGHTGKMITRSNARKAIHAYLAALASPAPAESGEPVVGKWRDIEYLMSVIDAAIDDGFDPDEDGPVLDEIRAEVKAGLHRLHPPAESAGSPSTSGVGVTNGWRDVIAERQRQVEAEGWTPAHDDQHDRGELAAAAVCYAFTAVKSPFYIGHIWPWSSDWWKPKGSRRNLVKAAALILAEIERLDRADRDPSRDTQPALLSTDETQEGGNG